MAFNLSLRAVAWSALICAFSSVGLRAEEPPSRLVNISVRNHVGTGNNVLIAGFVIVGDGDRPILVRSIGPTLTSAFNVPGSLADPQLGLFDSSNTVLEANDDWGGTDRLLTAFGTVGAFPLSASSLDSAILRRLGPGAYTCVSYGKGTATGEALLELYDGLPLNSPGHALANLSLRGFLDDGGLFIAGFVIEGTKPKTVLLRAAGPVLASFGVADAHPNPDLFLYQGQELVASNTDWNAAADPVAISGAAKRFGAFAFPASGTDAALYVTLLPGNYSAHIAGSEAGQSGTILVEVYDADFAPLAVTPKPPDNDPALPIVSLTGPQTDPVEGESSSFTLSRTGSVAGALTVTLSYGGTAMAGSDYTSLPESVVIPAGSSSVEIPVQTLTDVLPEATESIEAQVVAAPAYGTVLGTSLAALLIKDAPLTNTGWTATYFKNDKWSGTPALTRIDPVIDFAWEKGSPAAGFPIDQFSVRWVGTLEVDVSQVYTFVAEADDGVWVWVDDQPVISRQNYDWQSISGSIKLDANVRHTVRVEMREDWGDASMHLYWFANGVVRELIPSTAVSPNIVQPATISGPIDAVAVAGAPFTLQLTGIGVSSNYVVNGLPAGLGYDARTGQIGGTFLDAGSYEFTASASNAAGSGSTRIRVKVVAADQQADTDLWLGTLPATPVIPYTLAPDSTAVVTSLASPGGAPGPFARRIRGTITAPATGLYTFWVRGAGTNEFWLADSTQPADRILRCSSRATTGWNETQGQRSAAVQLTAGDKYYFELVQNGSGASGDNAEVGWITPGNASTIPFEIVPKAVLSHWLPDAPGVNSGKTVFIASLRPPQDVLSAASGTASVSVQPGNTQAFVTIHLTGLSSTVTAARLLLNPGVIGETRLLNLTQSLEDTTIWVLASTGLPIDELLAHLNAGEVYVRVETERNPAGELLAPLLSTLGASTFVPPADPAPLPDTPLTDAQAARFLTQATFGPTSADILHLKAVGYAAWFDEQWALPASSTLPYIDAARAAAKANDPKSDVYMEAFEHAFWRNSMGMRDQLRQRVAFALSEIFVVSLDSALNLDEAAAYYDMLLANAGGNYRTLLERITTNPGMGRYLSMIRNQKTDLEHGIYPDENYAREVMQLFSIGLNKLHPDGTLVLDSQGSPVPTYTQEAIVGLAKVFTGWSYASTDPNYNYFWGDMNAREPMQLYPKYHDKNPKRLIESIVLPEGGNGQNELRIVMDLLANHPNTGPYICRQLIQRLVTANPSPSYVYRVAKAFADNGSGARGDLKAVVHAILLDPEARRDVDPADITRGKLREPVLRFTQLWRAFHAAAKSGDYDIVYIRDQVGQEALNSPTVFNFFQPQYVPSGTLSKAGLKAPEFQITTESQVGNIANYMEWLTSSWNDDTNTKVVLDLTEARAAYAKSPDDFIDLLSNLLLEGHVSTDLRARLKDEITTFDNWVTTDDRIRYTIHTVLCSPDYVVER